MSTADDQATTVQRQATAEQPAVATAPESGRTRPWGRRLPSRIGRAHTSTVVIGVAFVVLFALWLAIRPEYVTVETVDGGTVRVPCSQVSSCGEPTPSETAPPTESPVAPTDPTDPATTAPTSQVPGSTEDDDEAPATTPRTTQAPAPTTGSTPTTAEDPTTGTDQDTDGSQTGGTPTG